MEPLDIAQGIVRGTYHNIGRGNFHEESGIYRFTNENITTYFSHLQSKEEVLSVISSGNHILNAILGGSEKIDGFDISVFPEYYLYLQIAAITKLSKEEYLEYLLSNDREVVFSDKYYDKLKVNLNGKYRRFWDYLYEYNEADEIYNSLLFKTDLCLKDTVIENNPYLQENNYKKLRRILKIGKLRINTRVCDISKTKFYKEYDLILLSNVLSYCFDLSQMDGYFNCLKNNFRLKENGEIIDVDFTFSRDEERKRRLNRNSYIEETEKGKILIYRN